ncbi:hypothetical protein Tco_0548038 [Tanacetum coccineum]
MLPSPHHHLHTAITFISSSPSPRHHLYNTIHHVISTITSFPPTPPQPRHHLHLYGSRTPLSPPSLSSPHPRQQPTTTFATFLHCGHITISISPLSPLPSSLPQPPPSRLSRGTAAASPSAPPRNDIRHLLSGFRYAYSWMASCSLPGLFLGFKTGVIQGRLGEQLNDDKEKGNRIMKDKKQKLTGIKEVVELEQRINNAMTLCLEMGSDMEVIVISHDDTSLDAYVFSYSDSSKDSHDYLSEDSSEDLINFLAGRDPQWQFPKQTEEEEPKLLDIEEEDPMSLDIVYPHPEIDSSSKGTNTRGQAHYGLRSLGAIHEEVVVVRKSYSLVKVTNVVLGLRAPKAEVGCFGSGRKRNS